MKKHYLLLILPLLIILSSCSPGYKLAKEFQADPPDFHLVVNPPGYVYKYNHKGEMIEGFDSLSEVQQDSALYSSSYFIRDVNDSVFLEGYVNWFMDELRMLGFEVYLASGFDSSLVAEPQSYNVILAQVQLDEYLYPYEDREFFYDTLYYKSFDLNAIDFSMWIELSKISPAAKGTTILYSSHMLSDALDGGFMLDPFNQHVKYVYNIDSLTVNDLYEIAGYLGRIHASYLYDFFMNQYILYHLPQGFPGQGYYHYNRFRKSFTVVEDERFEILERK